MPWIAQLKRQDCARLRSRNGSLKWEWEARMGIEAQAKARPEAAGHTA
jgi:hypothetical protein